MPSNVEPPSDRAAVGSMGACEKGFSRERRASRPRCAIGGRATLASCAPCPGRYGGGRCPPYCCCRYIHRLEAGATQIPSGTETQRYGPLAGARGSDSTADEPSAATAGAGPGRYGGGRCPPYCL